MTELAVTFAVISTKIGKGSSSSGGRLSEEEERAWMINVLSCKEKKIQVPLAEVQ
jgi:hypothetical protein